MKNSVTTRCAKRASIFSMRMMGLIAAQTIVGLGAVYAAPSNLFMTLHNPGSGASALNSQFGAAIAATGKTVYVGAPTYDQSGTDTGAVFAFDQKTGAPLPGGPLFGGSASAGDFIGSSLAANNKYWLTGAPGRTAGGQMNAGRVVLVVIRPGDGIPIENPLPGLGDNFGAAVAIYKTTVVIGAPKDTAPGGGPAGAGAAFRVDLKLGISPVGLIDPNAQAGDKAGQSVAVSKNYIVVGCPGRAVPGHVGAGVAVVYSATTGAYVRTLSSPTPGTEDNFGSAVAVSGTLISVGSPNSDVVSGGFTYAHAGDVFQFDGRTGAMVRALHEFSPTENAHVGSVLATDGKLLVVGAPDENTDLADVGFAYTYNYKTGVSIRDNLSEHPVMGGNFGKAAAIFKGGRYGVGEPFGQDGGPDIVGAAYMYNKNRN